MVASPWLARPDGPGRGPAAVAVPDLDGATALSTPTFGTVGHCREADVERGVAEAMLAASEEDAGRVLVELVPEVMSNETNT